MLMAGSNRFIEKLHAAQYWARTPSEAPVLLLVQAQNDGGNYHADGVIPLPLARRRLLPAMQEKNAEKNLCDDCTVSRQPATVAPERRRVAGCGCTAQSHCGER